MNLMSSLVPADSHCSAYRDSSTSARCLPRWKPAQVADISPLVAQATGRSTAG